MEELFVSDNQSVRAGDYLAVIGNSATNYDVLKLKQYLSDFDLETDSLLFLPEKNLALGQFQSAFSAFYLALSDYLEYGKTDYYLQKIEATQNRIGQYDRQYKNLLSQQEIGKEQFALAKKTFERDSLMHDKGGVSGKELDASRSQFLQSLMTQETMESQVENMQIQIAQLRESLMDAEFFPMGFAPRTAKICPFCRRCRGKPTLLPMIFRFWNDFSCR